MTVEDVWIFDLSSQTWREVKFAALLRMHGCAVL